VEFGSFQVNTNAAKMAAPVIPSGNSISQQTTDELWTGYGEPHGTVAWRA
jgi:hypothetical protein